VIPIDAATLGLVASIVFVTLVCGSVYVTNGTSRRDRRRH